MDRIYQYQKDAIEGKVKYNYRVVLSVMIPAIVATFIPWLLFDVIGVIPTEVLTNIVTWTLVPLLLLSLLLLQRYQLLGKYGESIVLLIPTFIWLLPEYDEVIDILLWMSMGMCALMIIFFVATLISMKHKDPQRAARISMVTSKFKFMLAGILITLGITFSLIDWGDYAMHWLSMNAAGKKDSSGESWIIFIAVVAIAIIMMLVLEGMFTDLITLRYNIIDDKTTSIDLSTKQRIKTLKERKKRLDKEIRKEKEKH